MQLRNSKKSWDDIPLVENVGVLEPRGNMKNTNVTKCNYIPHKIDVDLNMLCPLMLDEIVEDVHNIDVTTVNQGRCR